MSGRKFWVGGWWLVLLAWAATCGGAATMQPVDLRCDWAVDPIGVDATPPRLSWKLAATEPAARGLRQTAWQVLVASSAAALAQDRGDVWDSGRVAGDGQLHVPFAGRALRTAEEVFWKVRVWDAAGDASAWSAPARWTMGVLAEADWAGARWISDPDLVARMRPRLGLSTKATAEAHTPHWVQLDLGAEHAIDTVRLLALTHTVPERLGFPRWFKVELALDPSFAGATVIADHTATPYRNSWATRLTLPAPGGRARYVRLTVPQLRTMAEEDGGPLLGRLALSQIEVSSGGKNVAVGARVTASDSVEEAPFAASALVDGRDAAGANDRAHDSSVLRREVAVRAGLRRALFFVSGLGHVAVAVNGVTPGEQLLAPGWTDTRRTVLYDTHDLTAHLRTGANELQLTLAGGMFNVQPVEGRYTKFTGAFRPLTAIGLLRLDYADGAVETIVTDARWQAGRGPLTFNHVYAGEDYDARRTAGDWRPVVEVAGPGGQLRGTSHAGPPLRAHEVLVARTITPLRAGVEVYDFGQNTALMPRLRVRGPAGAQVKLIPAELLQADGSVDRGSSSHGGAESSWNYTLRGDPDGETWAPHFFYHGARYVQVQRTAPAGAEADVASVGTRREDQRPVVERLEARVVHSDSPAAGEFATSSELFNRIHALVRWAQRSNLSHVITDCPHRERLGWLEQYHLNGPALRYAWDLTRLYGKTFGDMADAQAPSGLVPDIAPEFVRFDEGFRDSPEWGSAVILAAWQHFVWTGDDSPLRRNYDVMQRYVAYLERRAEGGIVSHGLGDWYDLGPNRPGLAQLTPIALTATAITYEDLRVMARIATHLGRDEDAADYERRAAAIGAAFNTTFFDAATATYATGSQTAQAMPLVLSLVPEAQRAAALDVIVRDVRGRGDAITAGDVGYRYLLRALAEGGRSDVIFAMNHQSEKPGYGFQLAKGATSLTEAWDANPHSSQNHFMLGQIMEWFYHDLVGLAPDPEAPGWGRVLVAPQPVGALTWAEATHQSPRGAVRVRWERNGGRFRLVVEVPPNATARVVLPARGGTEVREGGGTIGAERAGRGVRTGAREEGRVTFEVGSGRYEFTSELPEA